jgi:hypothetical protein
MDGHSRYMHKILLRQHEKLYYLEDLKPNEIILKYLKRIN